MPPAIGGMNEQYYRDMIEVEFLDRVYSGMLHWRKDKIKRENDIKLVEWLVKEGLMTK